MRAILLLLIITFLFVMVVSGVVLNLLIIIIKITGSIALTQSMVCSLYALATLIVAGLLWLFVKIGGTQ